MARLTNLKPRLPTLQAAVAREPAKVAAPFYKTARWLKLRALVLAEEPLCRKCEEAGKVEPATEVDHIVPIARGGGALDRDNLQGLCKPCHSRKTATEDSAFARPLGA